MHQEIEKIIEQFNTGWTEGDLTILTPILHEKVVFMAPDLQTEFVGRESCLQTIKDYINQAETKSFEVKDKKIHIWEDTATATIEYTVSYEMNDQFYREEGKEAWTLVNQNGSWLLVWRAMIMNKKI